jgi:hypothetical protein
MKDDFYSRIDFLPFNVVQSIYNVHKNVELNNVLEGFKSDFYTIILNEERSLDEYTLMYVGGNEEIRGFTFKSGRKIEKRDFLTFKFSKAIEKEFPAKNALVVFNAFQSIIKNVYENFGIICIPEYIANLGGELSVILPDKRKRGIDRVLQIDILRRYKSYFTRSERMRDEEGLPKVYLMYDKKEGYIKIGETKTKLKKRRKGVSEPTLRATDPMIEIITAWNAPKELETKLHSNFFSKRKRGEWFDLKAVDLEDINKMTLKYNMIDV